MTVESTAAEANSPLAADLVASVAVARQGQTVAEVFDEVRRVGAAHVAVCHEGQLVGLVDAVSLLGAQQSMPLESLLRAAPAVVSSSTRAERAAWLAAHAGADVVAVNDEGGLFLGLIPAHRLLALMVQEHEIDLARLGGFLRGTTQARTASEERVSHRVWHRAPWLLVGLLGAVVAAQIVSAFEEELTNRVALAFFLPGIVYMADALGTQTETLVVRGLSVGISARKMLRLEALTGAVMGVLLSVAIFPLALAVTGDTEIASVVSLSLLAASACATVVAVILPFLIEKLNFDPAFGSGPLATVVQDLLSISIYLALATTLIGES